MKRAVFLDRDGTIIEEQHYLRALDHIQLVPGSADAIRLLRDRGFVIVVVTNQAGVAKGYFDEAFVERAHRHLDDLLRAHGASVDRYYYCPHHPDGVIEAYRCHCECRKPATGLIEAAQADLGLDLAGSFVVGDKWLDVELADRAGATGILVRSGYGRAAEREPPDSLRAAVIVDTLLDAAQWILANRIDE
jgi:D-glycero-D-manno-heptose 1,7-bisphosphate phosphatase